MKSILATLCLFAAASPLLAAEQVTLQLRSGSSRELQTVVIDLHPEAAPKTVENFQRLVRKGFYDGIAIHRVFPNYLVQTGDPRSRRKGRSGVGTGGPGYTVPPEIRLKTKRGAVAAARLPDKLNPARLSNGSQFFVLLKSDPKLDGNHTVFGTVSSGIEILEAVSNRATDSNDSPVERTVIHKARLGAPVESKAAPKVKRFWLF